MYTVPISLDLFQGLPQKLLELGISNFTHLMSFIMLENPKISNLYQIYFLICFIMGTLVNSEDGYPDEMLHWHCLI